MINTYLSWDSQLIGILAHLKVPSSCASTHKFERKKTKHSHHQNSNMPNVRYDRFGSLFDHYAFERSMATNNAVAAVPKVENKKTLWNPSGLHIDENKDGYTYLVDVPGVKPSDMSMQLVDDKKALYLRGLRIFESGNTKEQTTFERRVDIASDVDVDKIEADLKDDVLTISAPKKEEPKRSNADFIPISPAGSSSSDEEKKASQ
eukprot:scaffold576_cov106-Cylindrotheca_fusiformis.AAC.3